MIIAEKIQDLLRLNGLSQVEFEPLAGLPKGRVSKWLSGQGEPTARQALRMAKALGVTLDYLVDDDLSTPPGRGGTEAERQLRAVIQKFGAERVLWRLVEVGMGVGDDEGHPGPYPSRGGVARGEWAIEEPPAAKGSGRKGKAG